MLVLAYEGWLRQIGFKGFVNKPHMKTCSKFSSGRRGHTFKIVISHPLREGYFVLEVGSFVLW
jgi:hypothetical protein